MKVINIVSSVLVLSLSIFSLSDPGLAKENVTIGWTSYPADIPVIADAIQGGKDEAEALGVELIFALGALGRQHKLTTWMTC